MTHGILQGLHKDHINISKVAAIVASELVRLENDTAPDYDLLDDIMTYVTGYPDTYHHPTEDLVFARLRQAAPEAGKDIDVLRAEHVELIACGREFLEMVRAVEDEAVVVRAEFLQTGRSYLNLLAAHMDKEEAGLFELAARCLGPEDWEAIGALVEEMEDPLFGPTVAADYRRLWQRITARNPIS